MRYVIWHEPRTGSNMLCSMLHQTGVAGFAQYVHSGYFIGWPNRPLGKVEFDRANERYFKRSETPNGVQSSKASMQYFDDLGNKVNWKMWQAWLDDVDYHITLTRDDKVAQAVSMIFGGSQNLLSSDSPKFDPEYKTPIHEYNRDEITWKIAQIGQLGCRFHTWLKWAQKPYLALTYEGIVANMQGAVQLVMDYCKIDDPYTFQPPHLKKQSDPRKAEWIKRYKAGD